MFRLSKEQVLSAASVWNGEEEFKKHLVAQLTNRVLLSSRINSYILKAIEAAYPRSSYPNGYGEVRGKIHDKVASFLEALNLGVDGDVAVSDWQKLRSYRIE